MFVFALGFDQFIAWFTIVIHLIRFFAIKWTIKQVLEEYVNFVDVTKEQNKYIIILFIMFYKQHILVYQYHLYFDNIAHKYTDDRIV